MYKVILMLRKKFGSQPLLRSNRTKLETCSSNPDRASPSLVLYNTAMYTCIRSMRGSLLVYIRDVFSKHDALTKFRLKYIYIFCLQRTESNRNKRIILQQHYTKMKMCIHKLTKFRIYE